VGSLVASHNMFEAERLLVGYVLLRRNALSSTAAIEYALINVSNDTLWIVQVTRCLAHAHCHVNVCACVAIHGCSSMRSNCPPPCSWESCITVLPSG
jgi:hypothetical protein